MVRILIIGIGNPVPSFIHRRLFALLNSGVSLTIVAEHGQEINLPKARVIRIGGTQNRVQQFLSLVYVCTNPLLFFRLLFVRPELSTIQRCRWAVKYFPLIRVKDPGAIHLQWLSAVTDFQWLKHFFNCPLLASARGSQLTVYPLTRSGFKTIIEHAVQKVDYIHCVSQDMAQACVQLGATQDKIFVNYNGIDLQKFSPRELRREAKQFTMISVGALMWRKSLYYQLQLLRMIKRNGYNVQLLLLGDGPDREGLQYTAHILKIEDCITFAGEISASELPEWLAKADLYISTSVAEGLANSVVEAASCGLPVIAFSCEGMKEIVEPGVNGFVVPVGDIENMKEKVQYLVDYPEERKQMGANGRQRAVKNFDERVWVSLMIEKYKSIGTK